MGCYAASNPCGELDNAYGPFDYTNTEHFREKLPVVEHFHFTSNVENLISGQGGTSIIADLNYTLRAFPNHHRALLALSKYERQQIRKSRDAGMVYQPGNTARGWPNTAECYFDRAIRWRPNDPAVRLIYGIHLHLTGKLQQAIEQYKIAEKMQPNVADLQYNLGLLYFDMKQYALAKQHARKAYQLGYPLPGLRKKLASVGQWP